MSAFVFFQLPLLAACHNDGCESANQRPGGVLSNLAAGERATAPLAANVHTVVAYAHSGAHAVHCSRDPHFHCLWSALLQTASRRGTVDAGGRPRHRPGAGSSIHNAWWVTCMHSALGTTAQTCALPVVSRHAAPARLASACRRCHTALCRCAGAVDTQESQRRGTVDCLQRTVHEQPHHARGRGRLRCVGDAGWRCSTRLACWCGHKRCSIAHCLFAAGTPRDASGRQPVPTHVATQLAIHQAADKGIVLLDRRMLSMYRHLVAAGALDSLPPCQLPCECPCFINGSLRVRFPMVRCRLRGSARRLAAHRGSAG